MVQQAGGKPADGGFEQARALAAAAHRPLVLTGAGVSAESGLPTFRGAGGLWRDHRPAELATPEAFQRDPELVWEFYCWRRSTLARARPNPAHEALARYERSHPELTVVTQNVDGLHRAAGSTRVLELHGRLTVDRCFDCGREEPADLERPSGLGPPRCLSCEGRMRPGVVWFGEPVLLIGPAFELAGACDLLLVAGTSGVVEPAATVARVTRRHGAPVIEVNPEETPLSDLAVFSFRMSASAALPLLLA